jgi:glycosyltransferase involved in cell wall biosynthesis
VRDFTPANPGLSVIIVSYNARDTITACLESLEHQAAVEDFEVILVDSSEDGTGDLVASAFPGVRLLRFPARKYPGDARNIGIAAVRSDIIAFIDADCRADRHWVSEILKAHRQPHLAIGGAVANGDPASYVGWAAYLCEFSQWMPAEGPRWLADIPTANMTYKRAVFEKYGRFIEGTYSSDTELHWRLARAGHRLRWEPSLLVWHTCIDRLGEFLRHEFRHGRSFGRVRVRGRGFGAAKRLLYVLATPLIPLKLMAAIFLRVLRDRTTLPHFLRTLPVLALGVVSWCLGECRGYAGR